MTRLVPVTISDNAPAAIAWARGLTVSLPPPLADQARGGSGGAGDAAALAADLRLYAAFTNTKPVSSRLPFTYQRIPLPIRTAIGGVIGHLRRRQKDRWARFPKFPLDLSADVAADLAAGRALATADGTTRVLLSHDLDTPEGLANAVRLFAPIEERFGAVATSYIVPCAWEIDHGLLGELAARGHEIGIHGFDHGNRTPFADPAEQRRRIASTQPLVDRYGITGYRAPSLLRTPSLLKALRGTFLYDSSIPTSGGLFPVPNNGCATTRPFRISGMIEIPLTLPRDGSLRFLGYGPEEIFDIWLTCAEQIRRAGGVVSLLTHCEGRFSGNAPMLRLYERFLGYLQESGRYSFSKTSEIVSAMEKEAAAK